MGKIRVTPRGPSKSITLTGRTNGPRNKPLNKRSKKSGGRRISRPTMTTIISNNISGRGEKKRKRLTRLGVA